MSLTVYSSLCLFLLFFSFFLSLLICFSSSLAYVNLFFLSFLLASLALLYLSFSLFVYLSWLDSLLSIFIPYNTGSLTV